MQKIDPESHRVVVGEDEDLYAGELTAAQVNWVALVPPSDAGAANVAGGPGARSIECEAKIRYLHQAAPASLTPLTSSSVRVTFRERQRAITPGQSVVFYDGDIVLGGGVIE